MAIIYIPDDAAVTTNLQRRSFLRNVGGREKSDAWVDEPIVGEITSRVKTSRTIVLLNGTTTLAGIRKLTIIGHGASAGFLIGPYAANPPSRTADPPDPIFAQELAAMLQRVEYKNGHSIDVIACFGDFFAKRLSETLKGIYVKGYTDPVTVEDVAPIYPVGGKRLGRPIITPDRRGAPTGLKGKNRYLNGELVGSQQASIVATA